MVRIRDFNSRLSMTFQELFNRRPTNSGLFRISLLDLAFGVRLKFFIYFNKAYANPGVYRQCHTDASGT